VYLINFLSLQAASQLFIQTARFRTGQQPVGPKDGVNITFTVPVGDKFTHNLPFLSIHIYCNGVRLTLIEDYVISESGGPGTGYDTVLLEIPPEADDQLLVDYVAVNT
jgi:hypothetical protein